MGNTVDMARGDIYAVTESILINTPASKAIREISKNLTQKKFTHP